jgi:diguanylate cyclase (GGDEF)-like protein
LAAPPEEAERILGKYMDSLKNEEKDERYRVTVSVGISEISGKLSMEQMIKKADEALYRSKENGRNQISVL